MPNMNKEQAEILVNLMKERLGPEITSILNTTNLNTNHMIRFMYIGNLCQKTREEKELSLKDVSRKLKIPQYKLKDIESSYTHNIQPDILETYIQYLGLDKEMNQWLHNNKDVYEGLGK